MLKSSLVFEGLIQLRFGIIGQFGHFSSHVMFGEVRIICLPSQGSGRGEWEFCWRLGVSFHTGQPQGASISAVLAAHFSAW